MYSAKLLDHFEHPRGTKEISDPTHRARVENPACGDVLELSLSVTDGTIQRAAFKAKGCVPAMACASALTALLTGQKITQTVTRAEILAEVDSVPPASGHAVDLAVDAAHAALRSPIKPA
jgi:nitrogen fixation protein NifU and related proteins